MLIYDFQKNKQTLLEAQFSLWKFLAIFKNSELVVDNFLSCSGCSGEDPIRNKE